MADFKKSLETGLAANADATAKRNEIYGVVADVSQQLTEATNGVIAVELKPATREVIRHLTNVVARITGEDKEITHIRYTAFSAKRLVDPGAAAELGQFELEPTGYPLTVTYASEHAYIHDRESLEKVLARLLEHPDTGSMIQRLLNMKPKTPPT